MRNCGWRRNSWPPPACATNGDLQLGALGVEADQQVEGLLLVTRPLADLGSRVEAEPLGHQLPIANPDRVQRCGIEVVAYVGAGIFDGVLGLDQEPGEVVGPALVPPDGDRLQLSEVVGVAERMVDAVVAVGLPAIVNRYAGHRTNHPEVVHG